MRSPGPRDRFPCRARRSSCLVTQRADDGDGSCVYGLLGDGSCILWITW